VLTPVECFSVIIEDARKEEKGKYDYDRVHKVLSSMGLTVKECDQVEFILGYRDEKLQLLDVFKNEKFRNRGERLKKSFERAVMSAPPRPPAKRRTA